MDRFGADSQGSDGIDFPVGATLRRLRKHRGMSLQMLATASGVSVGMISQVERGLANPSMRLLTALRRALNISLQELFGESGGLKSEAERPDIRRRNDRPVVEMGALRKEMLSSTDRHKLQLMILRLEPGGETGGRSMSYPTEKGGLVLKGRVLLTVDDDPVELTEGDSFVFDSGRPHSLRNDGTDPTEVLWVIGALQFDRHL